MNYHHCRDNKPTRGPSFKNTIDEQVTIVLCNQLFGRKLKYYSKFRTGKTKALEIIHMTAQF